jgi:hypothetical protein
MKQSDVAAILGPPPRQHPSEPYLTAMPPPTDPITWDYSNTSVVDGGVRLFVKFAHGRVTHVDSYIRTLLRDLRDEGPRHTVFSLDAAGIRTEGAEFKRVYCPSDQ